MHYKMLVCLLHNAGSSSTPTQFLYKKCEESLRWLGRLEVPYHCVTHHCLAKYDCMLPYTNHVVSAEVAPDCIDFHLRDTFSCSGAVLELVTGASCLERSGGKKQCKHSID